MPIPRPSDRSDSASWSHGGFHDRPASTCPCLRGDSVISREHGYAQVKQGLSRPALLSAPDKKSLVSVSSPILAWSVLTSTADDAALGSEPNTPAAPSRS